MSTVLQRFSSLPSDVQRLILLNLEGDEVMKLCQYRNKGACSKDDYLWKELMWRDYKLRDGTKREYLSYKNLVGTKLLYVKIGAYQKFIENGYWHDLIRYFVPSYGYSKFDPRTLDHIIDLFIENIDDINLLDRDGFTLLYALAGFIDIENLNKLLDKGADPNIIVEDKHIILNRVPPSNIEVFNRLLESINNETLNHIIETRGGSETLYDAFLIGGFFRGYDTLAPLLRARGAKTYAELKAEGLVD